MRFHVDTATCPAPAPSRVVEETNMDAPTPLSAKPRLKHTTPISVLDSKTFASPECSSTPRPLASLRAPRDAPRLNRVALENSFKGFLSPKADDEAPETPKFESSPDFKKCSDNSLSRRDLFKEQVDFAERQPVNDGIAVNGSTGSSCGAIDLMMSLRAVSIDSSNVAGQATSGGGGGTLPEVAPNSVRSAPAGRLPCEPEAMSWDGTNDQEVVAGSQGESSSLTSASDIQWQESAQGGCTEPDRTLACGEERTPPTHSQPRRDISFGNGIRCPPRIATHEDPGKRGWSGETDPQPACNWFRTYSRAPSATLDSDTVWENIRRVSSDGQRSDMGSTPQSPDPLFTLEPSLYECPPTPAQPRFRYSRRKLNGSPRNDPYHGGSNMLMEDIGRRCSLTESKVLIQTNQLTRTESVMRPECFQFQDHFEHLGTIGCSKYSEVSAVRHKGRGDRYAIKKTRRQFRCRGDRERCMREILAVAALRPHPNIVGHYRAWQQDGYFFIQMDLCAGGSLAALIHAAGSAGKPLEEAMLWRILLDVSEGLAFLHAAGVLHLDIKPANIYRDSLGNHRVGDFGMAVLREEWDAEDGDGDYVAPETLRYGRPKAPADVYSLGATMYECATLNTLPRSGEGRLPENVLIPDRSEELQEIVRSMLSENPDERPAASDVAAFCKEHGFASVHSVDRSPSDGGRGSTRKRRTAATLDGLIDPIQFDASEDEPCGEASQPPVRNATASPPPIYVASPAFGIQTEGDADVDGTPVMHSRFKRNFPAYCFGHESCGNSSEGSPRCSESDMDVHDLSLELSFD
uniref:Membrane-associated tyrosine-and threonine-specific cdc2-inhibitory kinase n=1 Tax=Tetraselmis sp. GSL018 TaxID=582737 RepID=A0A061RDS3_9CHLO